MNWIKCSEQLPEVGEWVLIFTKVRDEGLIEIATLDLLQGFINPAMGYGSFKNVTYWAKLPEPPNE